MVIVWSRDANLEANVSLTRAKSSRTVGFNYQNWSQKSDPEYRAWVSRFENRIKERRHKLEPILKYFQYVLNPMDPDILVSSPSFSTLNISHIQQFINK